MSKKDIEIIEFRSKQVIEKISDEPEKWGKIDILFQPGTYDGNDQPLVRPFRPVNLVGYPAHDKPVIFKKFKIHDALLVNCCLDSNVMKGASAKEVFLEHHLRLFNVVLTENTLSNCSKMSFEDLVAFEAKMREQEQVKPSSLDGKSIVRFLRAYLSTMRRFLTLLPDDRKSVLPEYIRLRFKVSVIICRDGVAIWFRRPIKKRKYSMKVSKRGFLRNVIPQLSADKNIFPLNGQSGIVIRNLALVTRGFANSVYKMEGTFLKIPDQFGILEVKSGADIKLENVLVGFLDRYGKPRQLVLKGLWVIANDAPSIFSVAEGKQRAQRSFFRFLLGSGPIKGEKMRHYSEADMSREIASVEKEYLSLVLRENVEEPELQQFLERHPFILSPTYLDVTPITLDVTPQARLSKGKRIVDFLLLFHPDLRNAKRIATLVEIKRPNHALFTKNGKYSKPLEEGLQQLDEAFRILDKSAEEAKKFGLRDSDVLKGIILIGRRTDLRKDELSHLEQINKGSAGKKIATFDDLKENIETVKSFYGAKGRQPVVVIGQKGTNEEDFTGKTGETIQRAIDYLKRNGTR